MYKINHKVIFISILTQLIFGFFWLTTAPSPFISNEPEFSLALVAALSVICFVYFYAWLISKLRSNTRWEMAVIAVCLWLFCILPNLIVSQLLFDLTLDSQIYLFSFSAVATLLNAFILPFSRSSRSIFKG